MFPQHFEEASLKSWPARQQSSYDGWLLRFSEGYTKRANSVTVLSPSSLPLQEKILFCEQTYHQQHLPPIFRLLSYSPEALLLDQTLAVRSYQPLDPTLVLSLPLSSFISSAPSLTISDFHTWFDLFCQFSPLSPSQQKLHYQLLTRIASPALFAILHVHTQPVACGLGILEANLFGLFDIIVAPTVRRRGHGTRLITGMLEWAQERGAQHAYLQVVRANEPARNLYDRLGFREQYHYWYRVAASLDKPSFSS